ncbi:hypothetical protein CDV36_005707 [Fusarium kuroshium]|uniref:Uncharacterized protein n=1 Tax=Fusarium kuroshium TaxID=2010991 RepID=A0A3M2SBG3_9HYPO|nr:hypothetical protein CDV36_005707 [Fusarium kuroshium]
MSEYHDRQPTMSEYHGGQLNVLMQGTPIIMAEGLLFELTPWTHRWAANLVCLPQNSSLAVPPACHGYLGCCRGSM